MKAKKILFIHDRDIQAPFVESLRRIGYEVDILMKSTPPKFHKTIIDKFVNIFYIRVLKIPGYYSRTASRLIEKWLIKSAQSLPDDFDTAVILRADRIPFSVLELLKKKCKQLVAYQFDGLSVSPNIFEYKETFDRIYCFDPNDYHKYKGKGFLPLTNCWFPDDTPIPNIVNDFFYVGVGLKERKELVMKLNSFLKQNGKIFKAYVSVNNVSEHNKIDDLIFSSEYLPYSLNLDIVKSSKILLDFKMSHHDGLSFRFFEAMNYGKKIITNNTSVKEYDFYRPENILVTDYKNFEEILKFAEIPAINLPKEIRDKYGLSNWIRIVTDEQPFLQISLP